jgi:hypothetical protein
MHFYAIQSYTSQDMLYGHPRGTRSVALIPAPTCMQVVAVRCRQLGDGANWATSRWKLQEIVVSRLDTVGAEASPSRMAWLHHEPELAQRTHAAWHFHTGPGSQWIGEEPLDTSSLDRLIDEKDQLLRKVCSY